MTTIYKATKPNIGFSAKEGYHSFQGNVGSFEVFWNCGEVVPGGTEGWYWWPCFEGCLPDGEPTGPFYSSSAAYNDARN